MEDEAAAVLAELDAAGVDIADRDLKDHPIIRARGQKLRDRHWLVSNVRRRAYIREYKALLGNTHAPISQAAAAVGWSPELLRRQRKYDRTFDAQVRALKSKHRNPPAWEAPPPKIETPILTTAWKPEDGFAAFRKAFFGMDSPWFHLEIVNVLEESKPGTITLILVPPEHGKTTLLEDWTNFKLAVDPSFRVVYASKAQSHARKVVKRLKSRMHPDGPCPTYVDRFGPFVPQVGDDAHPQAWNADYFDVWRKMSNDDRDFSLVALGFGSEVIGSRCDLLVLDDVQSSKSLNLTDKLMEEFRQDWWTRPGTRGRTVIIGNRVGQGDFYEKLMDEDLVDHLVVHPAVDHQGRCLWPERYSPAEYETMKKVAGVSWSRNYQQKPSAAAERTFTAEDVEASSDPSIRFGHLPTHIKDLHSVVIGLDPGFGINAIAVAGITPDRMVLLDWRTDHGLTSNDAIAQVLGDTCAHWQGRGLVVGHVVIEDKFIGTGLLTDESFAALRKQFGFAMSGHKTGWNKLDDEIGVTSMARSFRMGEIALPGADDPDTQRARAQLDAELASWRPNKRGSKLRQDLVMAMWFCWIRWRVVRQIPQDRSNVIRMTSAVARPTPFKSLTLTGTSRG